MNGVKISVHYDFADGLVKLISEYLQYEYVDEKERLVMAALEEVKQRLMQRMLVFKKHYKFTLTASQSLGLMIFHGDFLNGHDTSYMGNKLRMIADEVRQKYQ